MSNVIYLKCLCLSKRNCLLPVIMFFKTLCPVDMWSRHLSHVENCHVTMSVLVVQSHTTGLGPLNNWGSQPTGPVPKIVFNYERAQSDVILIEKHSCMLSHLS